jgi:hypothetical protein
MNNRSLDFSFSMESNDRQAILEGAAEELDALQRHLSVTDPDSKEETTAGDFVRTFAEDVAEFASFPTAYKITDEDFLTRDVDPPIRFKRLAKTYNFYWLYFPIALFPRRHWAFNLIEVRIEFNRGSSVAHARPAAHQILPDKKFETLLQTRQSLEIGIDENFEFSVYTGNLAGQLGAPGGELNLGADVKTAAGMGMVAGPFMYRIKRAAIDHTPVGMAKVFWRLDGPELFEENTPPLVVVAQVPKETKEVTVSAEMQAYRHRNYLSTDIRDFLGELPRIYKNFLTAGVPIRAETSWDISPRL